MNDRILFAICPLFEVIDEEGAESDCLVECYDFLVCFDSVNGSGMMFAIGSFPFEKVGARKSDVCNGFGDLELKLTLSNL